MITTRDTSLDEKEVIKKHIKFSHESHPHNRSIYGEYNDSYKIVEIFKNKDHFLVKIDYICEGFIIKKKEFEIESNFIKTQIRENKINKIINE